MSSPPLSRERLCLVKMKRIIYIILLAAILVAAVGGVNVCAAYEAENLTRGATNLADEPIEDYSPAVADEAENNGTPTDEGAAEAPPVEEKAEAESDGANPFAALWDTVKGYATEIFCSLTFIGSIILAYAYKKGLIPLLQGGISAISGTVSKIKESAERTEGKSDEFSRVMVDRLADTEVCLDGITEVLGQLKSRLDSLTDDSCEMKKMKVVMGAQVDMLYSIFMTSSLPQYQKDEVGEKIKEMKEALSEGDGE